MKVLSLTVCLVVALIGILIFLPKSQAFDDYNKMPPDDVVRTYWIAAQDGNEEVLAKIVADIPESYHDICEEHTPINKPGSEVGSTHPPVTFRASWEDDNSTQINSNSGIFRNGINSRMSLAYGTAQLIYWNQISISKMRITNQTVLGDEATVETQYSSNHGTGTSKQNFFLINKDGWKIFDAAANDSVTIANKNFFAKIRPPCESK